jgi:hypothetical protein
VDVIPPLARGAALAPVGKARPTTALSGAATRATFSGTRVTINCGAEANGAAQPTNSDITKPSNMICRNLPMDRRGFPVQVMRSP